MAELTVQTPTVTGSQPTYAAAAGGGDYFVPKGSGKHIIHVKNGHTSSQNVVVDDPSAISPGGATQFNPDVTVVVTNAQERMIAIDPARFVDPATGRVNLTYSGVTALTIGVFAPA